MRRAVASARRGEWPQASAVGSVTLDSENRRRRRVRLPCDGGDVLLDLPEAVALADGDGLELADGGWIEVRAAPEDLVEVTCRGGLARVAWHLGNRHCPADIRADRILIRTDRVIEDMLLGLGASVTPVRAPFDPERGAYGRHGHDR